MHRRKCFHSSENLVSRWEIPLAKKINSFHGTGQWAKLKPIFAQTRNGSVSSSCSLDYYWSSQNQESPRDNFQFADQPFLRCLRLLKPYAASWQKRDKRIATCMFCVTGMFLNRVAPPDPGSRHSLIFADHTWSRLDGLLCIAVVLYVWPWDLPGGWTQICIYTAADVGSEFSASFLLKYNFVVIIIISFIFF